MKVRWSDQEVELLRELWRKLSAPEVASKLGRSLQSVMSKASSLNLGKRRWTTEEDDLLRRLYPTSEIIAICAALGRTHAAINVRAALIGVKRVDSPERRESWRKHSAYMKQRRQKGMRNSTALPIGSQALHGGKAYRKVSDTGDSNVDWKLAHRVIWEEAHGPIPDGCVVVFRDGNQANLALGNLELITTAEKMRRHSIARYPSDIHGAAVALGRFKSKLKKLEAADEELE